MINLAIKVVMTIGSAAMNEVEMTALTMTIACETSIVRKVKTKRRARIVSPCKPKTVLVTLMA